MIPKKWGGILLIGEIAAYGAVGYHYSREISDGLALVVNTLFGEMERYFNIDMAEYQVESTDEIRATTIFFIYISVFLIGFVTYLIRNEFSIVVLLLATIWIAFIPEMVGLVPPVAYRLCYFAGLFSYGGSRLHKRNSTEKKFLTPKRIQGKIRIFQMLSIGIWVGIFVMILGEDTYKELTKDKSFKVAIQENMRRGWDNIFRGNFCRGSVNGGIGFGELGETEAIEYTGDTKLKLRTSQNNFKPIYLRGYIGSYYKDNTWVGLTKEAEDRKQRLESAGDIMVEDYDAALLYYYLAFLKYDDRYTKLFGEAGDDEEEKEFLAYQGKDKLAVIQNQFPKGYSHNYLSKVEVDNVAESYGTLFIPYYAAENVVEKGGKLSVAGKKNKGYYEWSVLKQGIDAVDLINREYGSDMTNWISQNFVTDIEDIIKDVEGKLGKKLEDYSTKDMGKEIVYDFFHLSEYEDYWWDSDSLEGYGTLTEAERAEQRWNLGTYEDADAKTILDLLTDFKKFRNRQIQYENFVKQTYLEVPEQLKERLLDTLKQEEKKWGFQSGIQREWMNDSNMDPGADAEWSEMISKLLLVKKYLADNTSYTLQPGAVPKGKDLVEYFLYENKKGFCSHYASSAVLMLRSLGIPARYVEGYMAGSTDLKLGKYEGGILSVDLTDENAHAWVVVYVPDFGWTPVEMTPGYSEGFELKEKAPDEEIETPKTTPVPMPSGTTASPSKTAPAKFTLPAMKKIKNILRKVMLVILVIFCIWIRKVIWYQYRKRKEEQPDLEKRMVFFYKEIDRILCVKKYKKKEEPLREWLQTEKEEPIESIAPKQWKQLLEVCNDCAFSNKPLSPDEVEQCRQLYHTLQEDIYQSNPWWKRVFYRYIRVL